jgi:hypothetical protein
MVFIGLGFQEYLKLARRNTQPTNKQQATLLPDLYSIICEACPTVVEMYSCGGQESDHEQGWELSKLEEIF